MRRVTNQCEEKNGILCEALGTIMRLVGPHSFITLSTKQPDRQTDIRRFVLGIIHPTPLCNGWTAITMTAVDWRARRIVFAQCLVIAILNPGIC